MKVKIPVTLKLLHKYLVFLQDGKILQTLHDYAWLSSKRTVYRAT